MLVVAGLKAAVLDALHHANLGAAMGLAALVGGLAVLLVAARYPRPRPLREP